MQLFHYGPRNLGDENTGRGEETGLMGRGKCAARENIGSRYIAAMMTQRVLVQAVAIVARQQLRASRIPVSFRRSCSMKGFSF